MQFLMLVLAGSDFTPPATIEGDTQAWVDRAASEAVRPAGGRLRPPSEAVVIGSGSAGVTTTEGARVADDEQIVGFDVLECADLDAAVDLISTHPMAKAGRIELRAIWDGAP